VKKILWLQFGYCKKEEPLLALNYPPALTPHFPTWPFPAKEEPRKVGRAAAAARAHAEALERASPTSNAPG